METQTLTSKLYGISPSVNSDSPTTISSKAKINGSMFHNPFCQLDKASSNETRNTAEAKEQKMKFRNAGFRNWIRKRWSYNSNKDINRNLDPLDIETFGSQLSCYESFRNQEIDESFRELELGLDFTVLGKASSFQVSKLDRLSMLMTPPTRSQKLFFEEPSPLLSQFSDAEVECSTGSKSIEHQQTIRNNNILEFDNPSTTSLATSSSNYIDNSTSYRNEKDLSCVSEIYMNTEVDKMFTEFKKDNERSKSLYFKNSSSPPMPLELQSGTHICCSPNIKKVDMQLGSSVNGISNHQSVLGTGPTSDFAQSGRYSIQQTTGSSKNDIDADLDCVQQSTANTTVQSLPLDTNISNVNENENERSNIIQHQPDLSAHLEDTGTEITSSTVQQPTLTSRNTNQDSNHISDKAGALNASVVDDNIENNNTNNNVNNCTTKNIIVGKRPSIKFHSKTKMLIYDRNSHASSLRRIFSGNKLSSSNSIRKFNRSLSRRISSLGSVSTNTASAARTSTNEKNNNISERSNLKIKVNANREVESVRASNCDEVNIEDFMCFFETHERRRLDAEPYLNHYREKQIENYYINN